MTAKTFNLETFNLEDVRIPDGELEQFQRKQKAAPTLKVAQPKRADTFAMVPLSWAKRVHEGGAHVDFLVCIDLVYRAWRAKGKPFVMPNIAGVHHDIKNRTLRALERAGLIAVQWRERRSPVITLAVPIA
jgi:hypothetical protein